MTTVPDILFDSDQLPVNRRIRAWQDFVGDHLADVDLRRPSGVSAEHAFNGSLQVRPRQHVTFARVRSAHQQLSRTPERIRRATQEAILMTFVAAGTCQVSQDGRTAELRPGRLCLYDSTRPYRIDVPGPLDALIVMIDRRSIEPASRISRDLCATAIGTSGPRGRIASQFWLDLARESRELDDVAASRFARVGLDLLNAALMPFHEGLVAPAAARAFGRARLFLHENLHRSDISIAHVADAVGLSVRRLQEIFRDHGTTVRWTLRELRLDAARQRLADPISRRQTIGSVAAAVGFADQAHFNRAFRQAFGLSPKDARTPDKGR